MAHGEATMTQKWPGGVLPISASCATDLRIAMATEGAFGGPRRFGGVVVWRLGGQMSGFECKQVCGRRQ